MFDRVRLTVGLLVFAGVLLAILWWLRGDTDGGLWVAAGWTWLASIFLPSLGGLPPVLKRFARTARPFTRAGAFMAGGIAIAGGLLYHLLRNGVLVLLIMLPFAVVLATWEQRLHEQRHAQRLGARRQRADFRDGGQ